MHNNPVFSFFSREAKYSNRSLFIQSTYPIAWSINHNIKEDRFAATISSSKREFSFGQEVPGLDKEPHRTHHPEPHGALGRVDAARVLERHLHGNFEYNGSRS
jgi:hypothetical protein